MTVIVVLLGHIHLFISKGHVFLKENGVIIDIDVIINNLFTKSHLIIVQLWKSETAATLRSKIKKTTSRASINFQIQEVQTSYP